MKMWEMEKDYEEFMMYGSYCKIIRNPLLKFLCGYVGVQKEHPLYGMDSDKASPLLDCHGEITYAGKMEEEDYWFFGFDCAHSSDIIPMSSMQFVHQTYRDFDYVREHVTSLAKQLHDNKLRFLFTERS